MGKIIELGQLRKVIRDHKKSGQSVVLCHGCFDLVHLGHLRHLQEAKAQGAVLVVTVTPDRFVNKGPDRPFFSQSQRVEYLSHLDMVDYVALNDWSTAVETIRLLEPSVYAKGKEYADASKDVSGKILDEVRAVEEVGGSIFYTDDIVFSSSKLINHGLGGTDPNYLDFVSNFKATHSFETINQLFEKISQMEVVVIGDTILDQYHFVVPVGMPTKASTVSVRYNQTELHAGGILAIANHTASFAKKVSLHTLIGDLDSHEEFIRSKLATNVEAWLYKKPSSFTVTKTRYIDQNQGARLLEVAHVTEQPLPADLENQISERLLKDIKSADLVILGDFGHYFITPRLLNLLQSESKFLSVNVQTNSLNYGFNTISKISKADYISIDEREVRLACQDRSSSVEQLLVEVLAAKTLGTMAVTQGARGALIGQRNLETVRVPASTKTTLDTVGAGDAFLAVSSLAVAQGAPAELIGFLGNAAGALATKYLGNQSFIEKVPYMKFIQTLLK